jgi:hypothetical protein
MNVVLFRQSHSSPVLDCRVFHLWHFRNVRRFHQFAFLPLLNGLARFVSVAADLFRL